MKISQNDWTLIKVALTRLLTQTNNPNISDLIKRLDEMHLEYLKQVRIKNGNVE